MGLENSYGIPTTKIYFLLCGLDKSPCSYHYPDDPNVGVGLFDVGEGVRSFREWLTVMY